MMRRVRSSPRQALIVASAFLLLIVGLGVLATRERELPLVRNVERAHFRAGPLLAPVTQTLRAAEGVITGVSLHVRAGAEAAAAPEIAVRLRSPGAAAPLREARLGVPASGEGAWVTAAIDPLAVAAGAPLELSVVPLAGGTSVSLAASRFDLYPDGRMVAMDGTAFGDQDLVFQVRYAVRPLGWLRAVAPAAPLETATVAALSVLLVAALVSIARRFQRRRTTLGTTGTIAAAAVAFLLSWLYQTVDVVGGGLTPPL